MCRRTCLLISLLVIAGSAFAQSASVEFVMLDTETQGTWRGVYGEDGYNIIIDTEAYPAYADVVATGKSDYTWVASTSDVRALERAAGTDRIAACYFQNTPYAIDIDLTDGRKHQVAVYFLDWDSTVRVTTVEVQDADSGEILDSQEMADYNAGKYLVWEIKGHVVINIIHVGGANSVISGLFFDKPENTGASEDPSPADQASDVLRDTLLSWGPGLFADKHDVYFGTVFADVNDADKANPMDVLVSPEQDATSYDPGRLDFGRTYYWRVDEVNGAPDRTVYKGEVWSFTAEPLAIPVEAITATASSSNADNMGPENTINGVGLNELDQHSTEPTEMWLSGMGDPTPSIQYTFDEAYKLNEMLVWNSNQVIESFVGIGAKDVVIEHSLDGTEWTVLEGATQFAQAPGNVTYTANTAIDFGGALAQYVKITISVGYGMLPQYGLSQVRFLYIPTFAREPMPTDGDTTEGADVTLSWRAGREAASHQIYLGTDAENLALAGTVDASGYDAGALEYGTTYFWQIVEVNESETPSSYAGPVWSFTTPPYGTVDSFEQYDDKCQRIFFAWEDGLGHNGGEEVENCDVPASNGNGGGSIVGNAMAPFAEQVIVNTGSTQSMPFNYDNAFGPSETTLTLDGQDWTSSGVQTLTLAFRGTAGNTGTLYVKINNSKVAYDLDPADIAVAGWQAWNIDLTAVSGLQNVTSLTIGVDGASAAGMLYIDDIRLYPLAGELITPADPGNANLAGSWNFDEGSGTVAADGSGNGNDGTIEGNANAWGPGQEGSALSLGGAVYVSVPAAAWSSVDVQFTVSFWAMGDDALGNNWAFMAGDANGRLASGHIPWISDVIFDSTADWSSERIVKPATDDELRGQWHHWTFVRNADTGSKAVYLDGRLYASASASAEPVVGVDRFFIGAGDAGVAPYIGLIDEFALYNRALSPDEILWLAGGTSPIHKPL